MKDTVVVAFGRLNPPTLEGHGKLLSACEKIARKNKADFFFAVSQSADKKKNPLPYKEKVAFIKKLFPKYSKKLVVDAKIKTPINLLEHFAGKYKKIIFVAGSDRVASYNDLLPKYNGNLYDYESIEVVSAGERDPDSDGAQGVSASKLRKYAADGDYESFKKGMSDKVAKELYDAVRKGMMIKEMNILSFRAYMELVD